MNIFDELKAYVDKIKSSGMDADLRFSNYMIELDKLIRIATDDEKMEFLNFLVAFNRDKKIDDIL